MMASKGSPPYDVEASIDAVEKRRLLQKKIKSMKLKQSKSPYWARPKKYKNADIHVIIEAHYKKRLAKYKETNTQLAHVVADQKLEIAHWYNEAVTLKSENQSLQEKLLRYTNLLNDELIDIEVERRIQQRCISLNQAVNSSMGSFLEAVEGISKVKELVGTLASSSSRRSRSIHVATSSLTPQLDDEKNISESDPYMNSNGIQCEEDNGQSLQTTPKLTRIWKQRKQDKVQASEEQGGPDMSIIREQSTILDDTQQNVSATDVLVHSALLEVSELSEMEEVLDKDVDNSSEDNETNYNDVASEKEDIELPVRSYNIDVKKRMSTIPVIVE
ncbi:unnamed protein product, partial [Meganyctiphanes norvegica]